MLHFTQEPATQATAVSSGHYIYIKYMQNNQIDKTKKKQEKKGRCDLYNVM